MNSIAGLFGAGAGGMEDDETRDQAFEVGLCRLNQVDP
jgi:hypothetical protein